jgi:MFS family permease
MNKIHYAWVVVTAAAVMRLSASSFRTASAVLIPKIVETFGWSFGMVGYAFAIQWIASGLFGPFAGWIGDRFGYRKALLIGTALFVTGMVLTSTMRTIIELYVYFGIIVSLAMAIFQVPLTIGVGVWFKKHLGIGMGILQSSQGLGPVIAVPIVLYILSFEILGLRGAFALPGIGGGIILLLAIAFYRNDPSDLNLRPLGSDPSDPIVKPASQEDAKIRSNVFLKRAQKTNAFWNLIGIHYWGCAGHAILVVWITSIAMDRGLSLTAAGSVFMVMAVSSTITRFGSPIMSEMLGSKIVMAVCFSLQVFPLFILFFASEPWMFYTFAALFGIGFGGEMSSFPIINRQYYKGAPVARTYGWQMMGAGTGMASGAAIGGLLRDVTGDFNMTIVMSMIFSSLGVLSIMLLPSTKKEQISDWETYLPNKNNDSAIEGAD